MKAVNSQFDCIARRPRHGHVQVADGRFTQASEILSSDCLPSAGSLLSTPSPCGSPRFSIKF